MGALFASTVIAIGGMPASYADAAATTIVSGGCSATFEFVGTGSAKDVQVVQDGNACVVIYKYVSSIQTAFGKWLVPAGVTTISYLVVGGGGGGGGGTRGGGGGAGGQVVESSLTTTPRDFLHLHVGRGYMQQSNGSSESSCIAFASDVACNSLPSNAIRAWGGNPGLPSTQDPNYSYGGGGATARFPTAGANGGKDGGAGVTRGGSGGGSGACGEGGNASASSGGAGGIGCESLITGSQVVYGSGGGGACLDCAGGLGGTGAGNGTSSSIATNPGAGSGGGTGSPTSRKASNGIIVLRYAMVSPPSWTDSSVSFGAACSPIVNDGVSATGTGPISYSVVTGGVLPKGLTFKSDGTGFTGVAEPSSYNFTLSASNAAGTIYSQPFSGTIGSCADIGIDSVTGPGTIAPGGVGAMTFVLANRTGPDAAPDATFTFRVPDNVTATPRGFSCTPTVVSGATTLTCVVGALPVSANASALDRSLIFDIEVNSAFVGGTTANGSCSVATTATDVNPTNNSAGCNFAVSAASADLRVTAWPDSTEKTTYAPNSGGSRSFKIENLGPSDAANPTFSFVVNPSNITPTGVVTFTTNGGSAGNWTCSAAAGSNPTTLNCSSSTPMQKGASIIAKVLTLADNSPNGTQVSSTATVGLSTTDPISSNNSISSMLMFVDLRPDLNISGFFDSSTVVPGTSTKLRLRVANGGSVASNGPTTVTFTLPAGLTLGTGDDVPSKCTANGGTITCMDSSGLSAPVAPSTPGGSVEFVLPVTVIENAVPASSMSLTATVPASTTSVGGASGGETNLWNNSATIALVVGPSSLDLVLGVSRPPSTNAGETATIHLTVTNNGPSTASGFTLRYDLPLKVSLAGSLPSGCVAAGVSIFCTRASAFSKGNSELYSLNVLVDDTSLSGLTVGGSMEVNSTSIDLVPVNNKAGITEANLDVVGILTTTTTTTTTTTPETVTAQVKKKVLPNTGLSVSNLVYDALRVLLFGAGLMVLSRRRELRW